MGMPVNLAISLASIFSEITFKAAFFMPCVLPSYLPI